jgi:hypothetical protein
VTVPLQPAPTPPPASPAPTSAVKFPIGWLLEHGTPPLQYRAITEVARGAEPGRGALATIPLGYKPAMLLALSQAADGSWGRTMLGIPGAKVDPADPFEGVGTISAVRRLLEYGWGADSPPLDRVRRLLFRMLAEDEDPAYLYEFAQTGTGMTDEDRNRRGRAILREAAACVLAQAGYESDPRLRGAARRIIERINGYLKSPLAQKPWVRVGNRQVLAPDATPPSIHALTMLAFMPQFRSEHHEHVERLYLYLTQPLPRQESAQLVGSAIVMQPHLILGDLLPHRNVVDSDVPFALMWMETLARLGFLRRHETWLRLFERFLDDRDRGGVWHPHKGTAAPRTTNAFAWSTFPLEERVAGDERYVDITFRLGLIARILGRPIDLV